MQSPRPAVNGSNSHKSTASILGIRRKSLQDWRSRPAHSGLSDAIRVTRVRGSQTVAGVGVLAVRFNSPFVYTESSQRKPPGQRARQERANLRGEHRVLDCTVATPLRSVGTTSAWPCSSPRRRPSQRRGLSRRRQAGPPVRLDREDQPDRHRSLVHGVPRTLPFGGDDRAGTSCLWRPPDKTLRRQPARRQLSHRPTPPNGVTRGGARREERAPNTPRPDETRRRTRCHPGPPIRTATTPPLF